MMYDYKLHLTSEPHGLARGSSQEVLGHYRMGE